jgi:ubiquitin carboxyl-terminal hydrolase MINDY-3/4
MNYPSMEIDPQPGSMADEEYAQYLQRQYDTESAVDAAISGGEGDSIGAISGSPFPILSDADETTSIAVTPIRNTFNGDDDFQDAKPAAQTTVSTDSIPFEQYGDSFTLYHYNGLRGGVMTQFRITRLTADEAVGASIALNRGSGGALSHGSSGTQDLEDVVRTKWPSCAIDWMGKRPPSID